ncbi:hypothetical protein EV421DRAFT_2027378 [Armillaria borealis]|uniref:Uncharacterized protein n=1 Tax=Armillaria borealis TaxID=47425 RepID=A0AA39IBX2_9AGAR|nr:hypothetical protein EV421DRAFT_2027378 [Armillaria borealis]
MTAQWIQALGVEGGVVGDFRRTGVPTVTYQLAFMTRSSQGRFTSGSRPTKSEHGRLFEGMKVVQVLSKQQQQDFASSATIIGHHHELPACSPFHDDVYSEGKPRPPSRLHESDRQFSKLQERLVNISAVDTKNQKDGFFCCNQRSEAWLYLSDGHETSTQFTCPKASTEAVFVRSARRHRGISKTYSGRDFPQRNEEEGRIQPSTSWIHPGSTTPAANMFFEAATSPSSSELLNSGHCALCFQHRKGLNRCSDRQKLPRKQ